MQRSARAEVGGLGVRVLSVAVLAPLFVLAVYLGGLFVDALILLGGTAMAFEWARLTAGARTRAAETVAMAAVAGAVVAQAFDAWGIAAALLGAGALAAVALSARRLRSAAWLAFGVVYLGAACLGFLWLRDRPELGLLLIAWLVLVVWGTDTGAYLVGKSLGGPRLAKRISPKKTWAGLLGGLACAGALSAGLALWQPALPAALGLGGALGLAAVGAALGVVEQAGDLLESAAKRRVGVKDAGGLIPGHGGVLDRCDGLVAASLALALLVALLQAEA